MLKQFTSAFKMARIVKYWKYLMHVFCIIMIRHSINECTIGSIILHKFERFLPDMKHILIWTDIYGITEEGQNHFIAKNCGKINCYFTRNKSLFGDLRYFDVIVFNVQDLNTGCLPRVRGVNQKYIFVASDSADNYPVCDPVYDDFFNWTWTYRVDSTISYRFISVYNLHAEELGSHFRWKGKMEPTRRNFQALLASKSKAVAVFLDICKSRSNREGFIKEFQKEMYKYNHTIDIFGKCGTKTCKRKTSANCSWRLQKQYFFFLAMEDSIGLDYVTGVVLPAFENNVVPVVYGGADYSKFLPPNSYLDARRLGIPKLAKTMVDSINKRELYHEFFRWRNHYVVRPSSGLDACVLCDRLNQKPWLLGQHAYHSFRKWWLPEYQERCSESGIFL